MVNIRRLRRKLKKNSNLILVTVVIFLAGVLLGASIKPSVASNSYQPEQSATNNNTQATATLSGEYIFKNMCMKCHTSPERYKSFTTYFGKPASVWAIGVQKMISVGNVQLSVEEVKAVTEYLAKTFKR